MEAQRLGYHWRKTYTGEAWSPTLGSGEGMCGQVENLPFSDRVPSVSLVDTGADGTQPGSSG